MSLMWFNCYECRKDLVFRFPALADHAREHGTAYYVVDFSASIKEKGRITIDND